MVRIIFSLVVLLAWCRAASAQQFGSCGPVRTASRRQHLMIAPETRRLILVSLIAACKLQGRREK